MKTRFKIKKIFIISLASLICLIQPLTATAAVNEVVPGGLARMLGDLFLMFGLFFIATIIAFLFYFAFQLMAVQKRRLYKEKGLEYPKKVVREPLLQRLYKKATATIPLEKEADILLDHNYDGIQELDNNLPPWWIALFYLGVAAGTVYFLYYHYFDYGLSSGEAYALEMKYANEAQARFLEKQANLVNESTVEALLDESSLASGAAIFKTSCAACHGFQGEGLVGPNLTDDYWIHGGDIKSVFKTVKYGVPQKGMIPWKTQMNSASMHQVSSYIMTLKGTSPPNQKEAQGELYVEEKQQ